MAVTFPEGPFPTEDLPGQGHLPEVSEEFLMSQEAVPPVVRQTLRNYRGSFCLHDQSISGSGTFPS